MRSPCYYVHVWKLLLLKIHIFLKICRHTKLHHRIALKLLPSQKFALPPHFCSSWRNKWVYLQYTLRLLDRNQPLMSMPGIESVEKLTEFGASEAWSVVKCMSKVNLSFSRTSKQEMCLDSDRNFRPRLKPGYKCISGLYFQMTPNQYTKVLGYF